MNTTKAEDSEDDGSTFKCSKCKKRIPVQILHTKSNRRRKLSRVTRCFGVFNTESFALELQAITLRVKSVLKMTVLSGTRVMPLAEKVQSISLSAEHKF